MKSEFSGMSVKPMPGISPFNIPQPEIEKVARRTATKTFV
jgi:hypothetical protein